MAFNRGIFLDTSAIELAPAGLLSVARVVEDTSEEWLRGYSHEAKTSADVELLSVDASATVTNGTISTASGEAFHDSEGLIVSIEKSISGLDTPWDDPEGPAREELTAVTQKAAELELWDGPVVSAGSTGGLYLAKASGATIVGDAGGQSAALALRALEQSISSQPFGGRGIIHMTRDVASELGNRLLYKGDGDSATDDRAITRLGTRVVIGSGYSGNGPTGATGAAATSTNKWMYATSFVNLYLGPIEVVSNVKDAFDSRTNDVLVVLQRSIAVHFDPSVWSAARVTLPVS